jgi:hypothetical protein
MANILKRPMFRRGGTASENVGITSGLGERENFSTGTTLEDIMPERPEGASGNVTDYIFGPDLEKLFKSMPSSPKTEPEITIKKEPVIEESIIEPKSEAEELTDISKLTEITKDPIMDPDLMRIRRDQSSMDNRISEDLGQNNLEEVLSEDKTATEAGYFTPTNESIKSELEDIFAGLAATTPADPTQLQSYAQVLGKAGTIAGGLRREKAAKDKAFQQEVLLAQLKNLDKKESDQLIRYAKQYAAQTGMDEGEAIQLFLTRYLKGPLKEGTYKRSLVDEYIKNLTDPTSPTGGYSDSQAMNIANTLVKIRTGEISMGADRLPAGDDFDEDLPAGRYIDYRDGAIYTWDGETKTQVWPDA